MPSQEVSSTMLVQSPGDVNTSEFKLALEQGDTFKRLDTIKKMIALQLNGESMRPYIMPVMKYCCPVDDHNMRKLLLYFWEVVDKHDSDGNALPEMIMLCAFIRADLQHPNEYVRGSTLRFLCKLKERDLFEPLVKVVLDNLSHRVSYVRRNAVLAVHTIFQHCPQLIPDAPERIEEFIKEERDVSARRNAFNMLVQCDEERATRFLNVFRENNDITEAGDVFQLAVVDFVKRMISVRPQDKARYVPLIFAVMQSKNPAVAYQCACTLLRLSSSPTAIKHATQIFTQLLTSHSDSNVRLIALDRLRDMRRDFPEMLQESLMEIVRGLSACTSYELRSQILALCLELVTHKTVEAFVQAMKKELVKSQSEEGTSEGQAEYRQQVVRAIHASVTRHLHIAPTVIPVVLDYVCESSACSYDVIVFVREVMQKMPDMRESILEKLVMLFPMVSSPPVLRAILWLFGIHCQSSEQVSSIVRTLKESLAPLPLVPLVKAGAEPTGTDAATTIATTTVREDGTYGMAIQFVKRNEGEHSDVAGLRAQIVNGDYFLSAALANTLAKLVVKMFQSKASTSTKNEIQSEAIDVMHELVRFGTARYAPTFIDNDSHERIRLAITVAQNPNNAFLLHIAEDSYDAYKNVQVLDPSNASALDQKDENKTDFLTRADQPLIFSQLCRNLEALSGAVAAAADDVLAAVSNDTIERDGNFMSKLHRVRQLSGFSDPVYIEASVTVHQYDVLIEWLIVNQTKDTLSNLSVEVAAVGDMKLTERPQFLTLGPFQQATLKTSLKVSSTETGIIYGSCLFDVGSDRRCVILNEINIDIMDYIKPAVCSLADFRSMWLVFEWENKIVVNTDIKDLWTFVERVMSVTNMRSLDERPDEDCPYLSCSLYARSVFGEDALANISLELNNGKVEGVVRIRSKTQAIALGLGEKLSKKQCIGSDGPAGKGITATAANHGGSATAVVAA